MLVSQALDSSVGTETFGVSFACVPFVCVPAAPRPLPPRPRSVPRPRPPRDPSSADFPPREARGVLVSPSVEVIVP